MNKDVFVITNENWDAVYAEYQRLEAETKELREALEELIDAATVAFTAGKWQYPHGLDFREAITEARAALAAK